MTLPTGKVWYFTGFDKDGDFENWTMDLEEIQKNKKMLTGTGFLISKDGKILTNRHVAAPTIDLSDYIFRSIPVQFPMANSVAE